MDEASQDIPAAAAADRRTLLAAAYDHLQRGRYADCERIARQLVASARGDIDALLLLGLAIGAGGDVEAAAPILNHVARARPQHDHPCADLARLMRPRSGAVLDPAAQAALDSRVEAMFRAAIRLAPTHLGLRQELIVALCEAGRGALAVEEARALLQLDPRLGRNYNLLGLALVECGQIEAALAAFRSATEVEPRSANGWANLGLALKTEGRFDEALAAYREAVARNPGDAQVRLNHAITLLQAGRFAQGWVEYEWRLALPGHTTLPRARMLPALSERPDLAGRTVLVTHEEGFGDTLQFLRYLPLLVARGARVIAQLPGEIARLVRMPGVEVLTTRDVPRFDYHCPYISLPRVFGTTLETVPATIPYLGPDPELVARWAERLPAAPGLRVGLVWGGQSRPWLPNFASLDRRRSLPLAQLAPLGALRGVHFVSLQKGAPAAQAATPPPGLQLHDPMGAVSDFADTAAIIAHLDLVISVDTAVLHLAGAMGKPAFLLDRYDNCWRWLRDREDSPWYPTLRIFRQPRPGDWGDVIERATGALARRIIEAARPAPDLVPGAEAAAVTP